MQDRSAYGRVSPPDQNPEETAEWLEALGAVIREQGSERATFLLRKLLEHARSQRVSLPPVFNTSYSNTISLAEQPQYPGDLNIEARLSAVVRWNALAMVVRANNFSAELGGHLATFASIADLFEVGFNHFWRAGQQGDVIYFQPHAATGVYARAFLEGRLSEAQLDHYRRESTGAGLSSYCHPWLMPDFWQFPTGSMGLGPINAIYQARFMRYLEDRQLLVTRERKVWAFVGDGEMDEPEALAALSLAAREGLDNLIFVINCNLQRLDGPVRGNGSVVQELEGLFAGAGWNVIKLMWGSDWDALFARDHEGAILRRLHETVDGELQKYAATDGRFNREHFFNKYPELQQLVAHLTDDDIDRLRRGGHDPVKIYAAYWAATQHRRQPTVILAQTKKGYGMGVGQGRMGAHQQKKLENEALLAFRDRFALPLSDEAVLALQFFKPAEDSAEIRYLQQRRAALGGHLPVRARRGEALLAPNKETMARFTKGSGDREQSTTMVFVQLLSQWLRDPVIGQRIVPIVADEARTFGMQSLFRQVAIYSSVGQLYEPEDRDELLYYKEAKDGQILEEGITEAGAISSWIAAATSYSTHGKAMLPFYIFYSIFGFQRIGDLIWVAADSRARGVLLGATAGRTTLSGEGLQHEDGSSHLLAATVPNCVAYDPCYGYELTVILQNAAERMLVEQQDVFFYITVMNENYVQPAEPEGVREGIVRGAYGLRVFHGPTQKNKKRRRVRLLGSGTILREVEAAGALLLQDWQVESDVISVTSFTELRREGLNVERFNRLHPQAEPRRCWIEQLLGDEQSPVIAASDYLRAVPDLIRPWVKAPFTVLGTDGFGRSDTRKALRRFFEVDRHHVIVAALKALADGGDGELTQVSAAIRKYELAVDNANPWDI